MSPGVRRSAVPRLCCAALLALPGLACQRSAPKAALSLADAATASTALVRQLEGAEAGPVVARVVGNCALLASAGEDDRFYDDLLVSTYALASAVVRSARPRPPLPSARGGETRELPVAVPFGLSEVAARVCGLGPAPALSGVDQAHAETVSRLLGAEVLPRMARIGRISLEADGPLAGPARDYEDAARKLMKQLDEESGTRQGGAERVEPAGESLARWGIGSLGTTAALVAMSRHLQSLMGSGDWDGFARAYAMWAASPLVGRQTDAYEAAVASILGIREAEKLCCFRAYDRRAEEMAAWAETDANASLPAIGDRVRELASAGGLPEAVARPVSRRRALRLVAQRSTRAMIAMLLSSERGDYEDLLRGHREGIRGVHRAAEDPLLRLNVWEAWQSLWGDADGELGPRPSVPLATGVGAADGTGPQATGIEFHFAGDAPALGEVKAVVPGAAPGRSSSAGDDDDASGKKGD